MVQEQYLFMNTNYIEYPTNVYSNKKKTSLFVLCFFSILYSIFGESVFITIPLVCFLIFSLVFNGPKIGLLNYFYIIVWEKFTTLPLFSGVALYEIVLFLYTLVFFIRKKKKINFRRFLIALVILAYGILSLYIGEGFSGLRMGLVSFIAILFYDEFVRNDNSKSLISDLFLFIFISGVLSGIWGIINFFFGSNATVYVNGARAIRLKATVGTDRSCMLYCASLVYPLFFMKNKMLKTLSVLFIIILNLMTISITALVCLFIFFFFYVIYVLRYKKTSQKIMMPFFILLTFLFFVYIYNNNIGIGFIDNMTSRLRMVLNHVDDGDMVNATHGRSNLLKIYWSYFGDSNIMNKLFGTGFLSYFGHYSVGNYSHNTFLDMLIYFGAIPFILILINMVFNFIDYYKRIRKNFYHIFLFKVVYLFTALSVSMMSATYWWIIFII